MAAATGLRSVDHKGDCKRWRIPLRKGAFMSVILIFVAFVLIGDTAAVVISALFERVSNFTSLMVFFALYAAVFYVAWQLAVRVTERFFVRSN
jgi:hypothetical protein